MDIYLDTNIWNALCDQIVDPRTLVASLAAKDKRLILSDQSIYELAKTFHVPKQAGMQRGLELFSYLNGYLSAGVPIAKENMALLAAEMQALQWGMAYIYPYLNASDYDVERAEIEKLSCGDLGERVRNYLAWRDDLAKSTRYGQIGHFVEHPEVKQQLKNVSSELFATWLSTEMNSQSAIGYLSWQIRDYFPEAPLNQAREYAQALQMSPASRVAKGIIRRNLYYNWRCAHRESVPNDLFDDSNHVLNSNYCDIYATMEQKQMQYAKLLLTIATRATVYDGRTPIDEWLLALN